MSRRRTGAERAERRGRRRCPKCRGSHFRTKEYIDADLHICQNPKCRFPIREVKL